jgi:hypothetical protein
VNIVQMFERCKLVYRGVLPGEVDIQLVLSLNFQHNSIMSTTLHAQYKQYLVSRFDVDAAEILSRLLQADGFGDEAAGLAIYCEHGPGTWFTVASGPWNGRRCYVDWHPPKESTDGDLWLDLTELTMMVLIRYEDFASSPLEWSWLSIHPTYMWQFSAFLDVVRWRYSTYTPEIETDALNLRRFRVNNARQFVTEITYEEALAYSRWFEKGPAHRYQLIAASKALNPNELSMVLPPDLGLVGDSHSSVAGFSFVSSIENLDQSPYDELPTFTGHGNGRHTILHDPLDRFPDVGFCTSVWGTTELEKVEQLPSLIDRDLYSFIELLNLAPRTSRQVDNRSVVSMPNGETISLDVVCSDHNVYVAEDRISPELAARFRLDPRLHQVQFQAVMRDLENAIDRQQTLQDTPRTWGEAVEFRAANRRIISGSTDTE